MSVSLVVFRLELADNQAVVPDFHYEATRFALEKKNERKHSYAEVTGGRGRGTHTNFAAEELLLHRGSRKYLPITVETHYSTGMDPSLQEEYVQSQAEGKDFEKNETSEMLKEIKAKSEQGKDSIEGKVRSKEGKNPLLDHDPEEKQTAPNVTLSDLDPDVKGGEVLEVEASKVDVPHKDHHHDHVSEAVAAATIQTASSRPRKRYPGAVTQGSVDREEVKDTHGSRPSSAKGRCHSHSPTSMVPSSISFFSGNPSVETTEGIMHLYKDDQTTSLTDDVSRSEMICILAVPASIMSQELLHFLAPVQPHLESIRIVRDGTPGQYMVLVKFKSQKYADEFYVNYNHQPFNSIESNNICQLVYVAKLETAKSSHGAGLPMSGWTELPACPVCLERMDESVDGILTILCNHSFHSSCLVRWEDTSCPVCRYVQTPEDLIDNKCFGCGAQESLWICLICGHVGCGRYMEGHAFRHFQDTNHTYAMQLGRDRVWDYAGDNYVHRLVQNKGDGKLVEVDEGGNIVHEEKLDSITLEYTYLLTSQLESQRRYFEEKIEHIEKEAFKQVEEADAKSSKSLSEVDKLSHQLSTVQKEKLNFEKKITSLKNRLGTTLHNLQDETDMNQSLQANQCQWQARVVTLEAKLERKEEEIRELQEQLRDVMFYMEAQQKLANTDTVSQQEIQEGQIVMQSPTASGGKKPRKKAR